jgi:hypothetical protein
MSEGGIFAPLGGNFATSRKGGIDSHEMAFIRRKQREGHRAAQIAKMIGRSVLDVAPHLRSMKNETVEPESPADQPPEPKPPRIMLSLYRGLVSVPGSNPSRPEILLYVANRYGLTVEDLTGPSRHRAVTIPRQEAMWRMVEQRRWSFPQIGRTFNRDHSTIMHGHARHAARLAELEAAA